VPILRAIALLQRTASTAANIAATPVIRLSSLATAGIRAAKMKWRIKVKPPGIRGSLNNCPADSFNGAIPLALLSYRALLRAPQFRGSHLRSGFLGHPKMIL
jgi:hypothetical protein